MKKIERMLVVDDNKEIVSDMQERLSEDIVVETVTHDEFLSLDNFNYDLIIVDHGASKEDSSMSLVDLAIIGCLSGQPMTVQGKGQKTLRRVKELALDVPVFYTCLQPGSLDLEVYTTSNVEVVKPCELLDIIVAKYGLGEHGGNKNG